MWDTSLSKIGSFAAKQPEDTLFVAADWGVATQVVCLSQGRKVPELFWNYQGKMELLDLLKERKSKTLYVLWLRPPAKPVKELKWESTKRIIIDSFSLRGWHEVAVEGEVARLRSVGVIKCVKLDRSKSESF
jgi:hypothetical protein